MKNKVYIETSVVSYLTARDSSSLVGAAHQLITRQWWEKRHEFDLCISDLVVNECRSGDQNAAQRRIEALQGIPLLTLDTRVFTISEALLQRGIIPIKAAEDALHIAVATIHEVDYLLTWNFKHIANPFIQKNIAIYMNEIGLLLPFICSPEELLGDTDE